jgi:hypothetical protein
MTKIILATLVIVLATSSSQAAYGASPCSITRWRRILLLVVRSADGLRRDDDPDADGRGAGGAEERQVGSATSTGLDRFPRKQKEENRFDSDAEGMNGLRSNQQQLLISKVTVRTSVGGCVRPRPAATTGCAKRLSASSSCSSMS